MCGEFVTLLPKRLQIAVAHPSIKNNKAAACQFFSHSGGANVRTRKNKNQNMCCEVVRSMAVPP